MIPTCADGDTERLGCVPRGVDIAAAFLYWQVIGDQDDPEAGARGVTFHDQPLSLSGDVEILFGKTLGVYGLGEIGGWVAEVGRAFGMRVTVWGREASMRRARELGYEVPQSREAFFAGADVLTLHLFANAETEGIVKAADLACMKPTALFVNTSRMRLIENGALVAALRAGRPGAAAVDVYEEEPVLGAEHPLLHMPNVLCTPHLGYAVQEKFESFYRTAAENILAFAAGRPSNVYNEEALARR